MNFNSSNEENKLEIKYFDPKIKNADRRIKKQKERRGVWSDNRKLALLKAYREFRPHAAEHEEKTDKWNQVTDAVNKKDPHLHPLKKASVMKQLPMLVKSSKLRYYDPSFQKKAYIIREMLEVDERMCEERRLRNKRPLGTKEQPEKNTQMPRVEGNIDQYKKRQRNAGEKESEVGKVARRSVPLISSDEDNINTILKESIIERRKQHEEIMNAINANTQAIQAMLRFL